MIPLDPEEVHLWLASGDVLSDRAALEACRGWLTEAERARHQRYVFERNRDEFLATRALVRTTLSRYADVEPGAWVFRVNGYGRPEIAEPPLPLRFNLSNTEGLVACAVVRAQDGREIGVDVERAERRTDVALIAEGFFAPFEVSALRALPRELQRERFFRYWTLKEAYIKARGLGLAIPLAHFWFILDGVDSPKIAFDPRLEDDPATWQFMELRPGPGHHAALAVRRPPSPDLRVIVKPVDTLSAPCRSPPASSL